MFVTHTLCDDFVTRKNEKNVGRSWYFLLIGTALETYMYVWLALSWQAREKGDFPWADQKALQCRAGT